VDQHVQRVPTVQRQATKAAGCVVGIDVRVVAEQHLREHEVLLVPLGCEDRAAAVGEDQDMRVIRPGRTRAGEHQHRRYAQHQQSSHRDRPPSVANSAGGIPCGSALRHAAPRSVVPHGPGMRSARRSS
jgi:hypothetical protein